MKRLTGFLVLLISSFSYGQTSNTTNTNFTNGLGASKFFNAPNGSTNPTTGILSGSLFYKTGTGLQYWNGTVWQTVGIAGSGVTSFNGRNGAILSQVEDYSTFYPLLNGTGATGTWGINTTGSAGSLTNSLTPGYGISGTAFNGSAARTFLVDTAGGIASKTYVQNYTWTKAQADARFAPMGATPDLQTVTTAGATTTNAITVDKSNIGTTPLSGLNIINSMAIGAQYSPSLTFLGYGAGGIKGNRLHNSNTGLMLQSSLDGTTWTNRFSFSSTGVFTQTNTGGFMGSISPTALTANRNWNMPDADGTLALTSDIAALNLQAVTAVGASTTNAMTVAISNAGTSILDGLVIQNTNTTSGANNSPSLKLYGNYGSQSSGWQFYTNPTAVADAPVLTLRKFNGVSLGTVFTFNGLGVFTQRSAFPATVTISPVDISSNQTIAWPNASGTVALTSNLTSYVPTSRTISTGIGLSGGGDLTVNRTLLVDTTVIASKIFANGVFAPLTDFEADEYVPIVSSSTNLTSSTVRTFGYSRVKGQCTASGIIELVPTATGNIIFTLNFPIASNITSDYEARGLGTCGNTGVIENIRLIGSAGSDNIIFAANCTFLATESVYITFSYTVK